VRRTGDLQAQVGIGDVFGARVEQRAARAFATAARDWERTASTGEKGCTESASFDPRSWHIEREPGGWKAEGWSDTARICGYGVDFAIDGDLARVTARRDRDRERWRALHADVPRLTDAHFSPGASWVLATAGHELLLFAANAPDRPAARLTLGPRDSLVMVEWATGDAVARWDAQARRVRDMGPARPIVVR
jgi:hypothetical protein